jgi:SNF2 family DNA or RNA helicase
VRLVAQGTIEDKIAILKRKKQELAAAILASPDNTGGALTGLTDEDVELLLGDVDGDVELDADEDL